MTPTPMGCRRGEVRLANYNPSRGTEAGKIRPCIVLQSDLLNDADHPSTTVIPLTTRLVDAAAPLRFRVAQRGNLQADFDAMVDQIRTIDNRRFTGEALTRLTSAEIAEIEEYLKIVLGMSVG
jgi:mRNA interferase MazF